MAYEDRRLRSRVCFVRYVEEISRRAKQTNTNIYFKKKGRIVRVPLKNGAHNRKKIGGIFSFFYFHQLLFVP